MSNSNILIKKAIKRGGIVPIIGNDLSVLRLLKTDISNPDLLLSLIKGAVEDGDHITVNLYDYIAFTLISRYELEKPPSPCTLNNVALEVLKVGETEDGIKDEIIRFFTEDLKDHEMVLEPYQKLSRIKGFKTILTVNFDNFLERAFEKENNKHVNPSINFAIQNSKDDDEKNHDSQLKSIYNLMGNLDGTDFAITEEMSLEYLYGLQSAKDQKTNDLFKAIKSASAILLIGCSFPNWFMRFFIRTISDDRFTEGRKKKYVASDRTSQDFDLSAFLKNNKTDVIPIGTALEGAGDKVKVYSNTIEFIDELFEDMEENVGVVTNQPRYKEKIFLSYSWGDKPLVTKMKNEFEKCGVELFFDEDDLRNGERYEDSILNYIETCDYILFLISENSVKRKDSYVYSKEWPEAFTIERLMQKGRLGDWPEGKESYIRPFIIDDTSPLDPRIPAHFRDNKINITTIAPEDGYAKMVRKFIKENNLTEIDSNNGQTK